MKKRLLVLVVLVLCLSGCRPGGNKTDAPTPTENAATPTDTPTPTVNPYVEAPVYSMDELRTKTEVVFPDFATQTSSRPLLILLMDYKNSEYEYDETTEKKWSDYVFGTGTVADGTASVNDYFREISGGKCFFTPILLGDNTTGVYTFHMDKDYSDKQFVHPEYPFFDFSYDVAQCMSQLEKQGLKIDDFACSDINGKNFFDILIDAWDYAPNEREKEYYTGPTLMVVFPTINMESVDFTPICNTFDKFCLYAHLNETSSYGTICHELTHLFGAHDIYQYGGFYNDLMSQGIHTREEDPYNVTHVNPYYNLMYGWCDATMYAGKGSYRLYSASTGKYSPLLIPTEDPNQYFLIEARDAEGFDAALAEPVTTWNREKVAWAAGRRDRVGVTIWRIDQSPMNVRRSPDTELRAGALMENILKEGEKVELMYYSNFEDPTDPSLKRSDFKITVTKDNGDGSWDIKIN